MELENDKHDINFNSRFNTKKNNLKMKTFSISKIIQHFHKKKTIESGL